MVLDDNEDQLKEVMAAIEDSDVEGYNLYVSLATFLECEWVMRSFYKIPKLEIIATLEDILSINQFKVQDSSIINLALQMSKANNLGIEDNYHLASCYLNDLELLSFDVKLNKEYAKLNLK
jgi:predicted nucleic-acid-binding protein